MLSFPEISVIFGKFGHFREIGRLREILPFPGNYIIFRKFCHFRKSVQTNYYSEFSIDIADILLLSSF